MELIYSKSDHQVMSHEEKKALTCAHESVVSNGARYELSVPWQNGRPRLQNNYQTALNRLQNTEKRLLKKESLAVSYTDIIRSYEQKGYIHKLDPHKEMEPEGQVWFLPHFPVCRPDKTTTKTRICVRRQCQA